VLTAKDQAEFSLKRIKMKTAEQQLTEAKTRIIQLEQENDWLRGKLAWVAAYDDIDPSVLKRWSVMRQPAVMLPFKAANGNMYMINRNKYASEIEEYKAAVNDGDTEKARRFEDGWTGWSILSKDAHVCKRNMNGGCDVPGCPEPWCL
jgi:hypothetical protein